jgi:hypothetical protein
VVASFQAHTPAPLGTLSKTRSQIEPGIWRGKAWHGRAGQAFELVESGVVDRATAYSSPQTATDHKQDDKAAKTKPSAGSCSRILDQSLGSTRARTSRNRPLECPSTTAGPLEGGLDVPCPLRQTQLTSHRTPNPDVDVPRLGHSSVESGALSFMRKLSP